MSGMSQLMDATTIRRMCLSGELRTLRRSVGASQQDLADALGVHAATVARWETGKRRPRMDDAVRMHAVLAQLGAIA